MGDNVSALVKLDAGVTSKRAVNGGEREKAGAVGSVIVGDVSAKAGAFHGWRVAGVWFGLTRHIYICIISLSKGNREKVFPPLAAPPYSS
jgi:hypothetical protein